ncbi:DUF916 and DUF3324 domain-containing protein [Lactiplantibacillus mudanjiangensis]|uniref:Cell surface protein [Lactobacillus paraplantarum] n=1 Tax=Lactiplantibacillus mudanjiangensis TaxID=1296538 RepID=A0A660E5F6_9LACO|nr:DUF916 and DUF3324 domain-containing protein [Lactiplantibacillus mudanjiangensis]VDG23805.1 cell surface protein [Lactobacillus paraplantarum] [Lactiplantibacillus mudanjiangensis]VDG27434.1 cell surface protein [Lactobacillus paraplantarum] [Lactiplantibacillus mudanjiangensis]
MQSLKHKWLTILGILGLSVGLAATTTAQAAKNSSSAHSNNIGFSVSAKIPKNQIHKKYSFFDLKMTAGKAQTLKTKIYNVTNRDIKVQTAIHTAYTNTNGVIDYVTPAKNFDESLKYKMADITKVVGKKTLTIPANGSKTVSAKVQMPTSPFNGVVLGGWYFKRVDTKVTGTVKGSMNVTNQYSYVIGLKYSSGKTPAPKLRLDTVKAGVVNAHAGIFPYLRNVSAVIVPNLTMHSTITSKNSGKVVKNVKQSNVKLAPNTVYKYPMLLGNTKLQAGKYHLRMVVKNTAHRWVFDKDFTITTKEAKQYNGTSVDNNGINIWWLIGLGALAMLILILLILWLIFFIRRRRRNQDD